MPRHCFGPNDVATGEYNVRRAEWFTFEALGLLFVLLIAIVLLSH